MLPTAQLTAIPYLANSADWFARIRHLPQAIWLDSGRPQSEYGRFDILSAAPAVTLETQDVYTLLSEYEGIAKISTDDPFELIQQYLPKTQPIDDIPFLGGALGYFSYDLGRRLEQLPRVATDDIELPEMLIGNDYVSELKKGLITVISLISEKIGNSKNRNLSNNDKMIAIGPNNNSDDDLKEKIELITKFLEIYTL